MKELIEILGKNELDRLDTLALDNYVKLDTKINGLINYAKANANFDLFQLMNYLVDVYKKDEQRINREMAQLKIEELASQYLNPKNYYFED